MTKLPDDNFTESEYISDAARTEAEVKVALELVHQVIAEIGSKAPTTMTIASGEIDEPLSSLVLVDPEGSGVDDILVSIKVADITEGRMVVLQNASASSSEVASSGKVTITDGTAAKQIELTDSASFILCGNRHIALVYQGSHWVELWRSYGRLRAEDSDAERDSLGLGTAAQQTIATSLTLTGGNVLEVAATDLTVNQVLKVNSAGRIVAATSTELGGGDADTLDGHNSTAFVRNNVASGQTILSSSFVMSNAGSPRFIAKTTGVSKTPGYGFYDGSDQRALIYYNGVDGSIEMRTYNSGGTVTPRLRLRPSPAGTFGTGGDIVFAQEGGGWQSLKPGAGNGLNADMVDGSHLTDITDVHAEKINDFAGVVWRPGAVSGITLPDSFQTPPGDFADMYRVEVPAELKAFAGKRVNVTWQQFSLLASALARDARYQLFLGDGLHGVSTVPAEYDMQFNDADGSATGLSATEAQTYRYRRNDGTFDTGIYSVVDAHHLCPTQANVRFASQLTIYDFILPAGFDSFLLRAQRHPNRTGSEGSANIENNARTTNTLQSGKYTQLKIELVDNVVT